MYIIEHALHNLRMNKGRNILLGVILFAIITATVVTLAIYNTASISIHETQQALQCTVRIVPQRQVQGTSGALMQSSGSTEVQLTYEEYMLFAESGYLDGSDIKAGSGVPNAGSTATPSGNTSQGNASQIDAVYYLKHPDKLADFEAELRRKGLPDEFRVSVDESDLERMTGSMESLRTISFSFLLIVLLLGTVTILLLSIITIRERKYEIGVLRAMGMKRQAVALSLWIEISTVTCICLAFGIGAGAVLSQPVSDAILTGQVQMQDTKSSSLADRLRPIDTDPAESIRVSVSSVTVLEIFLVSFGLVSVAGLASVSRITQSEPIQILMERN